MASTENAFNDPYDISQDDEFIKEETIRRGYVRRSARNLQKNAAVAAQKEKDGRGTDGKRKKARAESDEESEEEEEEEYSEEADTDENRAKVEEQVVVSENGEYMCATCPKTFKSIVGRQRHMDKWCAKQTDVKMEDNDVPEGSCFCCGEDLVTAHTGGDFACDMCEKKFQIKTSLERHKRCIHGDGEVLSCPECSVKCSDKGALARHMYTHTGLKPWSCDRCQIMFTRKYHLDRHILQTGCDGIARPSHRCQVCNRVFNRKDNLREHLRAHAGVNKRRVLYHCEMCGKDIQGAHLFSRHKKEHFNNRPYQCPHCEKSFPTSGAQKKHIRKHTGEKPYECSECFTKFAAKETLNRHRKLHTGVRPFSCKFCGKGFIQASQLRAHVFYHTGEFGFKCDECDKSFNRKTRLDTHKKYFHQGLDMFKCHHCGRQFIRKEDLARHTLTHTGVKAFKCDVCEKVFSMKSSLRIHLLTHTKEPPRSCNYCNRAFIRQDCLLRHMRARHREKLEEILIEAERKKLQLQLLTITNDQVFHTSKDSSETTLAESVAELLKLLVDEETLKSFGAPDTPIHQVLDLVIKRCGHQPVETKEMSDIDKLRENAKLLFTVVIDDAAVKTLLNNQSVDEVILHVLNLAKS